MKKTTALVCFLAAIGLGQTAIADEYRCEFKPKQGEKWIPTPVRFSYSNRLTPIRVEDAIMQDFGEGFLIADLSVKNRKRLTITWELLNMSDHRWKTVYSDIEFRLTVLQDTHAALMQVKPVSMAGLVYEAHGACEVTS